ncbi:MAG TPA: RodZ domain-containing protein, partial [Gaiellaceae bacterium]|nr:RodZ domain-containing protein [Gaiellaceae bacterium]
PKAKVAKPKVAKPKPKAVPAPVRHSKPAPPKRKPAHPAAGSRLVRLSAAHGDCWLSVHRGSQSGPVLFEGTLVKGRVLAYDSPVWVRFGAASSMAVYVNGKQIGGLFGTVDAVVDRSGIHRA